jgi:hypothetical protein
MKGNAPPFSSFESPPIDLGRSPRSAPYAGSAGGEGALIAWQPVGMSEWESRKILDKFASTDFRMVGKTANCVIRQPGASLIL